MRAEDTSGIADNDLIADCAVAFQGARMVVAGRGVYRVVESPLGCVACVSAATDSFEVGTALKKDKPHYIFHHFFI